MNDRRLSKAEWAAMCRTLSSVPRQRSDIGALMRSSSDHVVSNGMLTIRFKHPRTRDRLMTELNDQRRRRHVSKIIQEYTGDYRQVKPELLIIRDYFVKALHEIMTVNGIPPSSPSTPYEVSPSANFKEVVQYTDWYVGGRGDSEPFYRFTRYSRVLRQALGSMQLANNSTLVHIDAGCGPGVFSWAFLDWAREKGIEYSHIRLYGYDHCEQMLVLASQVRDQLRRVINDYPPLNLHSDIRTLLSEFQANASSDTAYIITFGHVLAGNHLKSDIAEYISLIGQVLNLPNRTASVPVILSDVTSTHDARFRDGLDSLRRR